MEELEEKLNGNHRKLIPGLCLEDNEFVGEFKMVSGDVICTRG